VPRAVWGLGCVSLLMDVSSELIHALLPLYLVGSLGVPVAVVGVIEGLAEATATVTRLFSGALSDRIGKRKLLTVIGYGLSAASKPLFPLAASAWMVLAARCLDRVGKGIRDAPRDALIADITPVAVRGAAYGLRQALDSAGAFGGPLLAVLLMAAFADRIRVVLWWAVLPGLLSVLVLLFTVTEPAGLVARGRQGWAIHRDELASLGSRYWRVVGIGVLFTIARFSDAFLILRGQDAGLSLTLVPLVMVCMNIVYAGASAPAGRLSDRIGRRPVMLAGMLVLAASGLVLAFVPGLAGLFVGVALWGLQMALSQGLLAALVADTAPAELRGTGFGLFNLAAGIASLLASVIAGVLWQAVGPAATFAAGAAFAVIAAAALAMARVR